MGASGKSRYIACVGAAIVDCIIKGFNPEPISATGFFAESAGLAPGGEAVNQAVTFTKLGKKAAIVCFAGRDAAASILTEELRRNGVETDFLLQPEDAKTPVTVMYVDDSGDRKSITNRAHHYNFHPERDMSWMNGAEAVSLGSLFRAPFNDPAIVNAITTEAAGKGLPVYADTKLPNANRLKLEDLQDSLPMIDCIFPNEREGAFYTGETEAEAMADAFLHFGVRNVIIKLGEKGCLFKNADETIHLSGLPVRTLDATGAGDNFAAGFITMRSEGKSYQESLRFANACGALSTTAVGATAGLKSREEVLNLLR